MASTPDSPERFALLLAGDEDEMLVEVYGQIEWLGGHELSDGFRLLNASIRVARDVLLADFAVGEGGFSYLFRSPIADLRGLPESYDAIGATVAARVLREAFAAVSPQVIDSSPSIRSKRWKEHQGTDPHGGIDEFNTSYFQQDPEPEALIAQFVRDHASEISELFCRATIEMVLRADGRET